MVPSTCDGWLTTTCDSSLHLWPPQELQSCAHTLCANMQHGHTIKNKILQSKYFRILGHCRFWIFTSRMLSCSPMRNNILAVLWLPPPPCRIPTSIQDHTQVLHAVLQDPHSNPFLPEKRNRSQKQSHLELLDSFIQRGFKFQMVKYAFKCPQPSASSPLTLPSAATQVNLNK